MITKTKRHEYISQCLLLFFLLGVCTQVHDGDTISVKLAGGDKTVRVRLAAVDAPEFGQSFAEEAKDYLRELCKNRTVKLQTLDRDRYGRLVARVYLADGREAGRELIRHGYAWYLNWFHPDSSLAALQSQARRQGLGLWRQKNPTPPWKWRQRHPR
jgi:endonuclease YncB( thermonuclease family)